MPSTIFAYLANRSVLFMFNICNYTNTNVVNKDYVIKGAKQ